MQNVALLFDGAHDDLAMENGRLKLIRGELEVAQAVWLRLRCWQGELYSEIKAGIPYENYWPKGVSPDVIHFDLLEEVYADDRVKSVAKLEIGEVDSKDRILTVNLEATLANESELTLNRRIGA